MANVASSLSSVKLSNPFLLSSSKPHHLTTAPDPSVSSPHEPPDPSKPKSEPENNFDDRMKELRVRYKSETGKKAEIRKGRQSSKKGTSGSSVYLPPVPLKEPVFGGVKVEVQLKEPVFCTGGF